MKKLLILIFSILVGVFIVLSFIDTSDYAIEKKLWRLQRQFNEIMKDPKVVPEQRYEEIATEYRKIIKKSPQSPLRPKVHLQIGKVYILKKDYPKARAGFQEVVESYPTNTSICAEALFNVGKTYEMERNKAKAIAVYHDILQRYPLDQIALNIPLYIANYHVGMKDIAESKAALREAVIHYKRIASENPNTHVGFDAMRLLSTVYLAQQNWEESIRTLGEVLLKYPSKEYLSTHRANLLVKSINTVAVVQLKNYEIPISIYQKFIDANPDHWLNRYLKDVIAGLQEMKSKNISISPSKK